MAELAGRSSPAVVRTTAVGKGHLDLALSLAELSQMPASGKRGLVERLTKVASIAVRAIPGADGVGLIVWGKDQRAVVATSTEFVRRVDNLQYSLRQGPCVSVVESGTTVRSGSLESDTRWPRFGPRAGAAGVHSALSIALRSPTGVFGALNFYAYSHAAFDERSAAAGEVFAAPAAVFVLDAQTLEQSQRLAVHLQAALTARPVIDQAIGILRSRSGDSVEEALGTLRMMSRHQDLTLAEVAAVIVEAAAARARSRRRI